MSKSQIVFGRSFENASYKMVQLEPDIVKAIQTGGRLYIKGEDGQQCIIATDSKSFALEKIDTSNTVLFCEKVEDDKYIVKGTSATIVELVNNPMDSHKVLSHIPYLTESSQQHVSIEDLEQCCTYARSEIERCIRSNIYVVEDLDHHFYRISSQEYCSITMQIINNCLISGITLLSFTLEEVITSCSSIPSFLVKHLISQLLDDGSSIDMPVLTIHKVKLVKAIIRSIFMGDLSQRVEWLSCEELQMRVTTTLPSIFDFDYNTDQDCLIGEVIHEIRNRVVGFRFIDRSELSMNPEERFLQLFTIESEWSQEELVPYIDDLQNYGYGKPGDLLLKYCREVTIEEGGVTKKHFVMRR